MLCFVSMFLLPVGTEALSWVTSTASSCVKKKSAFLNIFTLCQQKSPETPAFHQAPWGNLAMKNSFSLDAKHFESKRESVSS